MQHREFIHGSPSLKRFHARQAAGCVATIGSFDGVHLGHQAIIERLNCVAKGLGVPSLAMIFEPQPFEYFNPEAAPVRLMRLREKVNALFAAGVDKVLCLKFNAAFRQLSAREFIDRVLVKQLGVRHLEIGDDFRFGCDRLGDFALLQSAGERQGFSVDKASTLTHSGARISSTRIRALLEAGELGAAEALLGKPFGLMGRVAYGRQLGRTLGVPTANLVLGRRRTPVQGVFAVKVHVHGDADDDTHWGVANVGNKPTLNRKGHKPNLEVHLLNTDRTLYGRCLDVTFLHKLRDEQRFESFSELRDQIHADIERAHLYFGLPST